MYSSFFLTIVETSKKSCSPFFMLNPTAVNAVHILSYLSFLLSQEHYKDLKDKPFFPTLIDYITSGPVVCMVYFSLWTRHACRFMFWPDIFTATIFVIVSCKAWEGVGVVASDRKLIGATNPLQAEPGTIRGDLAVQTGRSEPTLFHVFMLLYVIMCTIAPDI
jgi:nucleoside diphosphate kinase